MTEYLTREQYLKEFASMNNDELFNSIAQNYTTIVNKLQRYKNNPEQAPNFDKNLLSALLETCIKKTQKPISTSPNNYFSNLIHANSQEANEALSYEKKLLGAMKNIIPHTAQDRLGKKDFINVCEKARNLDSNTHADIGKRIASGRDTLLLHKSPLKNFPLTYTDKRGITVTTYITYDARYSDADEAFNDALPEIKRKNPLATITHPTAKTERHTTNTTYKLNGSQLKGGSYRI